ncbi:hypothetical protein NKH93_03510 [Mesorhizobium sp. M0954]
MTRRTRGISLPQLVKELKPYLIGWRGCFGFCRTPRSSVHAAPCERAAAGENDGAGSMRSFAHVPRARRC